jgi:hypothetical protein
MRTSRERSPSATLRPATLSGWLAAFPADVRARARSKKRREREKEREKEREREREREREK